MPDRSPNSPQQAMQRVSWFWIAAFLAPAAIMALILLTHGPVRTDHFYDGTRGAVRLTLTGPEGALRDGATVGKGDKLALEVSVPKAGYLLVVGVDDRRELTSYAAADGGASLPVQAGPAFAPPASLTVGGSPGPERIYALFTEHPVEVADIAAAVIAAHSSPNEAELPVHGAQSSVLLEKRLR